MSTHVHSAGAAGAAFAPSFLLRGPMHQHQIESLEASRRPIVRSTAVLLGSGLVAAVLAAALAAYLVSIDDPSKLSTDGRHPELPLATVQHEAAPAASPSANPDEEQSLTETLLQKSDIASASEGEPSAPRVVRTEHFQPDPSVWANVRKFSPLPPDQVPILGGATVKSPTAAPAEPDAPRGVAAQHHNPERANSHQRHRAHTHTRVRRSRTQAYGGAPSDVGGTTMTAEQVRLDGSKNPVVSTLSAMLGGR
jgi:hypothetical protein